MIVIFVINGEDVPIEADDSNTLENIRNQVLVSSHNTGRSPEDWVIRNEKGELLEPASLITDASIKNGSKLFLTLKIGLGGGK